MTQRLFFLLALLMMALALGSSSVFADQLLIRPQEVTIEPGGSFQFEAGLFNDAKRGVSIGRLEWKVEPNTLGRIDQNGLFLASETAGQGNVIATATVSGISFTGRAKVTVGNTKLDDIKIKIEPENAFVAPLGSVPFKVMAISKEGVSLRTQGVRWIVEPKTLGLMRADGTFQAGPIMGEGRVIAMVEIEGKVYRGEAGVVVSLPAKSAISGQVLGEAGAALNEALVTATRVGAPAFARRTLSDGAGNYQLGGLIPGWYVVKAEKETYIAEYFQEAATLQAASPVTLTEADTASGIDFKLDQGGSISGSVYAQDGVTPLVHAAVVASLPQNPMARMHTVTDEKGAYTLAGLINGDYQVFAIKDGYLGEFYLDAEQPDAATLVTVVQPLTTENINFTLATSSAITGIITDAKTGTPVAGATIVSYQTPTSNSKRPTPGPQTHSDPTGAYSLPVRTGAYYVMVEARGYAPEWYENALDMQTAKQIDVTAGTHTEVNVALDALGQVQGLVTDASTNLPIEGAQIQVYSELRGSRLHFQTRSDAEGKYQFKALPAGEYLVEANAPDYLPEFWQEADSVSKATKLAVANGVTNPDINFTLSTGGSISGVVTDADTRLPIANTMVQLNLQNGRIKKSARTDANGVYMVDGLPNGLYLVNAVAPTYQSQWYDSVATSRDATPVEVTAHQATEGIDFQLSKLAVKPRSISGTVLDDSTGMPIPNALVMVTPVMNFARPAKTITAADGSYMLTGLEPGSYILACHARGYIGEYYQDVRNWREAKKIAIVPGQEVTGIDFNLAPQLQGAYTISGQVKDRTGNTVGYALVALQVDQQPVAAVITADDGSYVMESLPADAYALSASATGYEEAQYAAGTPLSVGSGKNVYGTTLTLASTTTRVETTNLQPLAFALEQNYPNPFNPVTTIAFALPKQGEVTLQVFNLLGKEVKILHQGNINAGQYTAKWDGTDQKGQPMASGIYYYRLKVESGDETFTQIKRMMLLK